MSKPSQHLLSEEFCHRVHHITCLVVRRKSDEQWEREKLQSNGLIPSMISTEPFHFPKLMVIDILKPSRCQLELHGQCYLQMTRCCLVKTGMQNGNDGEKHWKTAEWKWAGERHNTSRYFNWMVQWVLGMEKERLDSFWAALDKCGLETMALTRCCNLEKTSLSIGSVHICTIYQTFLFQQRSVLPWKHAMITHLIC